MKSLKLLFIVFSAIFTLSSVSSKAQVKITDGAVVTMNANSILELESTNKGLLIPRMAINSLILPAPLTAPVPVGMQVYSSGGSIPDGFYYWNGTSWIRFSIPDVPVTKTATTTLLKSETLVLASNNITLTLPVVTSADNGLSITVKNVGIYTDLISIIGNSGALMDGYVDPVITRWQARTWIAWNGNWLTKNKESRTDNLIDVSAHGSFTTIAEVLGFLALHMTTPVVVRLTGSQYLISATQTINLPYPVTFEGLSYGSVDVGPTTGIGSTPLFNCITECYFKMITFDATTLSGYGSSAGQDAIDLSGTLTYHEIKDCSFNGFYNAVTTLSNVDLWLFENDISNSKSSGLLLNSSVAGGRVRIAETDFQQCIVGVNLSKGSNVYFAVTSAHFKNLNPTDIGILYNPAAFSFTDMIITTNSFNSIGTTISGFDFTLASGRDALAYIESNAGAEDYVPHCKINVVNNASKTNLPTTNAWYKAVWTNTSSFTTKFTVSDNKVTYQPKKPRDLIIIVSGNVQVDGSSKTITVGIVKNGVVATQYGATTLRITAANQAFQYSTVIYLQSVVQNDYFELYCSTTTGGDNLTFQDVNIYVSTQ